jgi:hypothetical protein
MITAVVSSMPEQGQLVNVRARRWVVNEVRRSTLPPPPLSPAAAGPQHLVLLSSIEGDGLGEELRVIWEIEPGAKVVEKVAFPHPSASTRPARSTPSSMPSAGGPPPRPTSRMSDTIIPTSIISRIEIREANIHTVQPDLIGQYAAITNESSA